MRWSPSTWRRVIDRKLESGQWVELKPPHRFRNTDGKPDGLAGVYMLSPDYWREIARRDDRSSNKRPKYENLPSEIGVWLARGTGLRANLPRALNLLLSPEEYTSLEGVPETPERVYEKALRAWRILSPGGAGELRPDWRVSLACLWLYSRRPYLQGLPQQTRLYALETLEGEQVYEADYAGCQVNIIRGREGEAPVMDPYTRLEQALRLEGCELGRATIKGLLLPVLHGRERHVFTWRARGIPNAGVVYDTIRKALEIPESLELMQIQGRIMLRVLEAFRRVNLPPGFPVFDSLVTPYPEKAREIMERESGQEIGSSPIPVRVVGGGQLRASL